jgi:hypothetical protein
MDDGLYGQRVLRAVDDESNHEAATILLLRVEGLIVLVV